MVILRLQHKIDLTSQDRDAAVERQALAGPGQRIVTEAEFVPAQNAYGGFVYAGATMAFTAAYWALHVLRPSVIAVYGCDMQYPAAGPTHFYGMGTPDPLRADITLRSLEAKSALVIELLVRPDDSPLRMNGSGMLLLNPPWQFDRTLAPALEAIRAALGEAGASTRLAWLRTPP